MEKKQLNLSKSHTSSKQVANDLNPYQGQSIKEVKATIADLKDRSVNKNIHPAEIFAIVAYINSLTEGSDEYNELSEFWKKTKQEIAQANK